MSVPVRSPDSGYLPSDDSSGHEWGRGANRSRYDGSSPSTSSQMSPSQDYRPRYTVPGETPQRQFLYTASKGITGSKDPAWRDSTYDRSSAEPEPTQAGNPSGMGENADSDDEDPMLFVGAVLVAVGVRLAS